MVSAKLQEAVTTSVISCSLSDLVHDVSLESSDEMDIHCNNQGYVLSRLRYVCFYFIPLWFLHDEFFLGKLTRCGATSLMRCLYKIRGITKARILPEVRIFFVLLLCFGRCFVMSCWKLWGVVPESILLPQFGS